MRFELICCPMSGVIELGSVKPPCMPHLSPDGGRWGQYFDRCIRGGSVIIVHAVRMREALQGGASPDQSWSSHRWCILHRSNPQKWVCTYPLVSCE